MRKILAIYSLVILFASNVFAANFYSEFDKHITSSQTKAGFDYFHIKDDSDLLALNISIKKAGFAYDYPGKSGLSKLLATTLTSGAGEFDKVTLATELGKIGAVIEVESELDTINISAIAPNGQLPKLLEILGSMLKLPHFAKQEFSVLKNRQVQLIEFEVQNPVRVANKVWKRAVFNDHPYANSNLGIVDETATITRQDLQKFSREKFVQENLVFSLVGNVDLENFEKHLDLNFQKLATASKLDESKVDFVVPLQKDQLIMVDKDVNNSVLYFGQKGVLPTDDQYVEATLVYELFLNRYPWSIFHKNMPREISNVYQAMSDYQHMQNSSIFNGYVVAANETVGLIYKYLVLIYDEMSKGIINDSEIAWLKKHYISNRTKNFDKINVRAKYLNDLQLYEMRPVMREFDNKVAVITKDNLNNVAKRIFNVTNLTSIIVGKLNIIEKELK